MVLFMKGQSVEAVGIGEAEELADDDEGVLGLEAGEAVGVAVVAGMLEGQLG
jgi:hypothetical protein